MSIRINNSGNNILQMWMLKIDSWVVYVSKWTNLPQAIAEFSPSSSLLLLFFFKKLLIYLPNNFIDFLPVTDNFASEEIIKVTECYMIHTSPVFVEVVI